MAAADYDPRYLAGIVLFNRRNFFEAHEVWEDIWGDCGSDERRFYQALIQAAVALLHFGNGNLAGARKLFASSRKYMEPYRPAYLGLDVVGFWAAMDQCFADVNDASKGGSVELNAELIPDIRLHPEPATWPEPEAFLREDEK
jgi:predicted metal-dependent hydrolase